MTLRGTNLQLPQIIISTKISSNNKKCNTWVKSITFCILLKRIATLNQLKIYQIFIILRENRLSITDI